MLFSLVTDNTPAAPAPLPRNYKNVSNFYLLPAEKVAEYGFYPYLEANPPAYDASLNHLVSGLLFEDGQVKQTWQIVPLTPEELEARRNTANITANTTGNITIEQLMAELNALKAQVAALTGNLPTSGNITVSGNLTN